MREASLHPVSVARDAMPGAPADRQERRGRGGQRPRPGVGARAMAGPPESRCARTVLRGCPSARQCRDTNSPAARATAAQSVRRTGGMPRACSKTCPPPAGVGGRPSVCLAGCWLGRRQGSEGTGPGFVALCRAAPHNQAQSGTVAGDALPAATPRASRPGTRPRQERVVEAMRQVALQTRHIPRVEGVRAWRSCAAPAGGGPRRLLRLREPWSLDETAPLTWELREQRTWVGRQ